MNIKPERQVEIKLWNWLMADSKPNEVVNVLFNSKNELGWEKFKVKGSQKKPDLIIELTGKRFYAVEVKDSSKSQNILHGSKIVDLYYQNYVSGKTEYLVNDNKILLDGFLIASQDSLKGFLFKDEEVTDNWVDKVKASKYQASKIYKIIPRIEGNRTFEFIRHLWVDYGKVRNMNEVKPDIGILIGNSENEMMPYMMITHYDENKNRWGQRWWSL